MDVPHRQREHRESYPLLSCEPARVPAKGALTCSRVVRAFYLLPVVKDQTLLLVS
jgi:hypothetical protein